MSEEFKWYRLSTLCITTIVLTGIVGRTCYCMFEVSGHRPVVAEKSQTDIEIQGTIAAIKEVVSKPLDAPTARVLARYATALDQAYTKAEKTVDSGKPVE